MRIKILYDKGAAYTARVVNAETGELLECVIGVRWEIQPDRLSDYPQCVLTMQNVAVKIEADAEVAP
jgi:hypothetical protein